MAKNYWTLLSREKNGFWVIEFGDYSRSTVNEEMTEYKEKNRLLPIKERSQYKMICTGGRKKEVEAGVAKENEKIFPKLPLGIGPFCYI